MRLLFLAHRLPFPPDKGDKIRSFHLLRCLARRHTVDVAALADRREDLARERTDRVAAICRRLAIAWRPRLRARAAALAAPFSGEPASLPFFRAPALAAEVGRWMREERYDAAWVHSAPMAQYVPAVEGMTRVADLCDVDSEKWRQYADDAPLPARWIYRREAATLRRYETRLAREWDAITVATEPEARLFRSFCAEGRLDVVCNGVDVDRFAPAGRARDPRRVVFFGAMDYAPNVAGVLWMAREVWPAVRRALPDARFDVLGSRPTAAVRRLHGRDGVSIRGYVDDLPAALDGASLAVAPLHIARGIQNKVLEAMAAALPVVATTAAAEGVEAAPGRDLVVEDEAMPFAAAIVALLRDPALAAAIGASARAAVSRGHSWESQASRLEAALARNAGSGRPAGPRGRSADAATEVGRRRDPPPRPAFAPPAPGP